MKNVTANHAIAGRLARTAGGRARPGFSLIELLVAIAIIGILLTLAAVGVSSLVRGSEERQTRMLLQQLSLAETEYRTQAGMPVVVDDTDGPNPSWVSNDEDVSIRTFLDRAWGIPESREVLQNIDAYLRPQETDPDFVVDAWGTRIRYRSSWNPDNWNGDDDYQLTRGHPRPFFVSAGISGEFNDDRDIYSFDVE